MCKFMEKSQGNTNHSEVQREINLNSTHSLSLLHPMIKEKINKSSSSYQTKERVKLNVSSTKYLAAIKNVWSWRGSSGAEKMNKWSLGL